MKIEYSEGRGVCAHGTYVDFQEGPVSVVSAKDLEVGSNMRGAQLVKMYHNQTSQAAHVTSYVSKNNLYELYVRNAPITTTV
jgi:hypothetical protein